MTDENLANVKRERKAKRNSEWLVKECLLNIFCSRQYYLSMYNILLLIIYFIFIFLSTIKYIYIENTYTYIENMHFRIIISG